MSLMRAGKLRAAGVCAAIAVGASLGILVPPAIAAPANDNFADRTDLGNELPVQRTESNAEATRETGEHISDFAKGRSIWWEWEAPVTGWTTVSTCASEFATVLNVFEGTELDHLTALTDEHINGDEGPACFATQTTYTFHAIQEHEYVIGADGNAFYLPPLPGEGEPHIPSGEGNIKLSIEATPPPSNDDFAAAIPIDDFFGEANGSPFEEPNDDRHFWAEIPGYNWGATKQTDEPEHAGDLGGASVWYSWTPSESGEAWISLQTPGGPKLLALYSGSSLAELVPVGSSSGPSSSFHAEVKGGTEYRIAVDGAQSEATGEPSMGSFELGVQMKVPPTPSDSSPETSATRKTEPLVVPLTPTPAAPSVKLGGHRVDAAANTATFRFGSSTKGATFKCQIDKKGFKPCSSPFKVTGLKPGKHLFEVVARYQGQVDPTPAIAHFSVPMPSRRHHRAP